MSYAAPAPASPAQADDLPVVVAVGRGPTRRLRLNASPLVLAVALGLLAPAALLDDDDGGAAGVGSDAFEAAASAAPA